MPVGFENSALKMSFSLSSLQHSGGVEGPERARLRVERPYNSLTKKSRKDPEQEMWRRSWGSRDDNKDEFWDAIRPDYNYLMDTNLIESCKEASGELSWDEDDVPHKYIWSYKEFTIQFSELYSWLNSIQEAIYGKEENDVDHSERLIRMEEMQSKVYRRKMFNDQANRLLKRYPEMQDEISWRVSHLNSKWENLEQFISPCKVDPNKTDLHADAEHETRCLRKWLHEMDRRLKPLAHDLRKNRPWGLQELEEKISEQKVLHQDVEAHSKVVSAVLRRCERSAASEPNNSKTESPLALARKLQRNYLHLYLRSYERLLYLEGELKKLRNPSPSGAHSESDEEEPVIKHPRLSSAGGLSDHLTDDGSYFEDDLEECCVMDLSPVLKQEQQQQWLDGTMVGTGETKTKQRHSADGSILRNGADLNDNCVPVRASSRRKSAPSGSAGHKGFSPEESSFNRSNRKAHNYATYYFKHLDTDSDQDVAQGRVLSMHSGSQNNLSEMKSVEESSEEEWTYRHGSVQPSGSGSSSETSNRTQQKRDSVVVRLDFGTDGVNSSNDSEEIKMLVSSAMDRNKIVESDSNTSSPARRPSRNSKESLQRLMNRAEVMVRESTIPEKRAARVFEPLVFDSVRNGKIASGNQAKTWRIKEWLKLQLQDTVDGKQTLDSCDASGEYTTGDSDDDRESESSEEQNGSITTYRHLELMLVNSSEAIPDPDATPVAEKNPIVGSPTMEINAGKVVMRTKRRQNLGERPWSVSGISQVRGSPPDSTPLSHFSISESALHQLASPVSKGRSFGSCTVVSGTQANLSSSTIDEASQPQHIAAEGSGSRTSSLRRRKVRLRKRTLGRKSESGSDGVTVGHSGSSDTQQLSSSPHKSSSRPHNKSPRNSSGAEFSGRTITKSGSFSGTPVTVSKRPSERCTASDPAMHPWRFESESTTGTETEEERRANRQRMLPAFRLGPELGAVTVGMGDPSSDLEKNSALAAEEQLSSFSEQAWDNYQEKYMSEPYSEELADSETARRLLEFGDDYSKFLDSQSDCASSLSARQFNSPARRRKPVSGPVADSSILDSDSDLEDIHHLIHQSHSQFMYSKQVLTEQLSKPSTADFAEIVATCRENLHCLKVILDNVKGDGSLLSHQECKDIRGLVEEWEKLQVRAEDLQKVRSLQGEMGLLRDELLELASRVATIGTDLNDREQLEERIQRLKAELCALLDRKQQLLHVNVEVHHLQTDAGLPVPPLKDEVTELYLIWDETFQSVSSRITSLERASQTWQTFETRLNELQVALRGDHNTLRMISSALQGGAVSPDVATSVRDVAKVLSEKQDGDQDSVCQNSTTVLTGLSTEGSLSDSGISDSGSEQELSERERRLAALRRLARNLEAELAPGSAALVNMDKRLEQMEADLRGLQRACRDLIVRTAVCVEARAALPARKQNGSPPRSSSPIGSRPHSVPSRRSKNRSKMLVTGAPCDPDDPDPGKHRPWLWRVMRAALPFQMALVALICVACLLEPHCCDAINSLSLSFTPQLRYVRGPPPV
ncbi:klarsicht protein [Anabrus simplex]|uniref:klarsicht protein n=1 Tax=Anabrus simplex TaxID=316456 RepID=UPI0035A388E0